MHLSVGLAVRPTHFSDVGTTPLASLKWGGLNIAWNGFQLAELWSVCLGRGIILAEASNSQMRAMVRDKPKPGAAETLVSWAIILVLVGIAGTIIINRRHPNPAVTAMEQAGGYVITGDPVPGGDVMEAGTSPLDAYTPEGFSTQVAYQTFDRETLSDKINGKADGYLQAGFEMLQWQAFTGGEESDLSLQVYVFDMGSFPNAFSVFSRQRRGGSIDSYVTANAYVAANTLCFVHGRFYVALISSAAHEEMVAAMEHFGEMYAAQTPIDQDDTELLTDLFPSRDMVSGSTSLIQANAFGFERLGNVYTASYKIGLAEAIAFVSLRASESAAAELADAFAVFWKENFDASETAVQVGGSSAKLLDLDGYYEIVFTHGPYLAGVHQATDRQAAERLAAALLKKIKQADK